MTLGMSKTFVNELDTSGGIRNLAAGWGKVGFSNSGGGWRVDGILSAF